MDEIRNILIYFALKNKGNWDLINDDIKSLYRPSEEEVDEAMKSLRCGAITVLDKEYPEKLKHVYKPPYVIFYYGDISILYKDNIIGVVGSRECSEYGLNYGRQMLAPLARYNPVIVSGLALGVDSMGHQVALDNEMDTIAVLGTGIDLCYPMENFKLYDEIKSKGLIISEYPFKENVPRESFASRNRLIAGLADFIFVPELKDRSGTLITVRFSLTQGKDILVLPHPLSSEAINNTLIREGAKIVNSFEDILEELKF